MNVSDTKLDILIERLERQEKIIKDLRDEVNAMRNKAQKNKELLMKMHVTTHSRITTAIAGIKRLEGDKNGKS